jgi:NTP pyrophosphatase (non-canonical NTP hydrolase)
MTINGYQKEALRTANGMNLDLLINGVMGLCGESGEAIDIVKKHLAQGHELDREHLAKELGDVAWYLAVTAHAIGYDLETVLQMNVDKLWKRYPDGFDSVRSQHREEGDM